MAKQTKKAVKKRVKKNFERGQAHIQASFNNTIVTLTDSEGNALSCSTFFLTRFFVVFLEADVFFFVAAIKLTYFLSFDIRVFYFFLPATVFLGPLRVRALVFVF